MESLIWLIIFVVLLVIELLTISLTTIWFSLGALAAFVVAIVGFGVPIQIGIFLIVSIVLLFLTRPIAVNYFNSARQKTNAEGLIGQSAIVTEEINTLHATGKAEVNGLEWSAKTDEEEGVIVEGEIVSIEGIQGVKLIVKKKEI